MNPNICNHCGGVLDYRDGHRVCSACGAYKQRIFSEEEFVLLCEAFQKLRLYEFDEAEREFEEIIRKYPENPEGYWGRLMAKYAVRYRSDADGGKYPICDTALEKSIKTEKDYIKAESLANEEMSAYYRVQAEYIDRACVETVRKESVAVFETDIDVPKQSNVDERTERMESTGISVEKNGNKKKIFWIAGISLGALLAVLTLIFIFTRECPHKETVVAAVSPTCTRDGTTEWSYCALCEKIFVPCETVPMLGHTPAESVICTEDQCCTVCGEVLRNAAGHIPGDAATCVQGQSCTVCHEVLVPALGHTPGDPASCTSGQYCTVCNEEISPACHVPGPPATCTEDQSCTLCGFVLQQGGHWVEPATCSSGSYCTVCNEQLSEPLDHVPAEPPTCTRGQMCLLCGEELVPENGHVPDGEAGCTNHSVCLICEEILELATGHMPSEFLGCTTEQYCLYCSEILVPATAHTPGPAATCTEAQVCLVCDEELVRALSHRVKNWIFDKEPALGVPGSKYGECSLCVSIVREEVAALYSDGLDYILKENGTYSVSGAGTCTDAWIVLPSVRGGIPVTSIEDNAFYNVMTLQEITIPEGITSIGARAFYHCKNLKEITLPEGIKMIGDAAFSGCSSVTTVSIPKGLSSIGNYAFSACGNLAEIELPSGLTNIGNFAFSSCNGLVRVTVQNGVTAIGDYAFFNCVQLKEVILPDSMKTIGAYAFYYCGALSQISIPAKLTSIGEYAFYRCTNLKELVLPETVTSIGDYSFTLCIGIGEITIPQNMTVIGNHAFEDCRKLGKIAFGGSSEQWRAISFGEGWRSGISAKKVICSDGEISLD